MIATDVQILEAARGFIRDNGYPPSMREVCAMTGISSPGSMKYRYDMLKKSGLIEYDERKSRTVRLTEMGEDRCR